MPGQIYSWPEPGGERYYRPAPFAAKKAPIKQAYGVVSPSKDIEPQAFDWEFHLRPDFWRENWGKPKEAEEVEAAQ